MTPHALIAPARLAGAPLLRAQSDERLVDLVRAGNDAAFEAIVARYRRPLLRYCSGFMPEARAEDAVQTALVSAFNSLRSSQGEMNLRSWLYRIAHNTALNALRDRALAHEELSEELDGVERPDQAFEKNECLRDVVAALGALPDRQRDAMVLRELEGRSYEAIATELGVTDGSVRQLLNRARNTLRSGMTAVTPFGLIARAPWGAGQGESVATRVAELCAGGAGAGALTKVCATALVTGAVFGGVAGSPSGGIENGRAKADRGDGPGSVPSSDPAKRDPSPTVPAGPGDGTGSDASRRDDSGSGSGPENRREQREDRSSEGVLNDDRGDDASPDGDRRGRGDDDEERGEQREAREEDDDRSGPGGGGDTDTSGLEGGGRSGSGHGGDSSDRPEDEVSYPGESDSSDSGGGEDPGHSGGSGRSGSSGSGSDGSGDTYPPSVGE